MTFTQQIKIDENKNQKDGRTYQRMSADTLTGQRHKRQSAIKHDKHTLSKYSETNRSDKTHPQYRIQKFQNHTLTHTHTHTHRCACSPRPSAAPSLAARPAVRRVAQCRTGPRRAFASDDDVGRKRGKWWWWKGGQMHSHTRAQEECRLRR
jgi:hypothetical protein